MVIERISPVEMMIFSSTIILLYMVLGSFMFSWLETDADMKAREKFHLAVDGFLNRTGLSREEINILFSDIRDAARKGIWMEGNGTNDPNWTFGQAFFFSGTLISTVGYGRVSPRTEHGKLFTIIYCIFGIPLTLALLSALVARLKRPSQWLREILQRKLGHILQLTQIQICHLCIVLTLLVVFMFMIPSWIFVQIETEWTYLDAFYYCFVSLTTIGLGDYEPGDSKDQPNRGIYKMFATVYLLVGLTCMMLFLATLYDIPQLNLSRFFLVDPVTDEECGSILNKSTRVSKYTRQVDDDLADNGTVSSASSFDLYANTQPRLSLDPLR